MSIDGTVERLRKETKDSITNSSNRKVKILDNGDKFVNDGRAGYVVDGVTGEIKSWSVRDGLIGGKSYWASADFRHNDIIGPGGRTGLYPKRPILYR